MGGSPPTLRHLAPGLARGDAGRASTRIHPRMFRNITLTIVNVINARSRAPFNPFGPRPAQPVGPISRRGKGIGCRPGSSSPVSPGVGARFAHLPIHTPLSLHREEERSNPCGGRYDRARAHGPSPLPGSERFHGVRENLRPTLIALSV